MSTTSSVPPQPFHRVVAAILVDFDKILFVHRSASREWAPDTWDVPGGHIEMGETAHEAAQREIREELGIEVGASSLFRVAHLSGPTWEVTYFRVATWTGHLQNAAPDEHTELRWMTLEEVSGLRFADPEVFPVLRSIIDRSGMEEQE